MTDTWGAGSLAFSLWDFGRCVDIVYERTQRRICAQVTDQDAVTQGAVILSIINLTLASNPRKCFDDINRAHHPHLHYEVALGPGECM